MASGFAGLALKAAAVAAILSLLLVPSLSRCRPVAGPAPPPPASSPPPPSLPPTSSVLAPAPAPGGPPVLCSDCASHCGSTCAVSVPPKCSQYCGGSYCDDCKSKFIQKNCAAECCSNVDGACTNSCICGANADRACYGSCNRASCQPCLEGLGKTCREDCNKECTDTCIQE